MQKYLAAVRNSYSSSGKHTCRTYNVLIAHDQHMQVLSSNIACLCHPSCNALVLIQSIHLQHLVLHVNMRCMYQICIQHVTASTAQSYPMLSCMSNSPTVMPQCMLHLYTALRHADKRIEHVYHGQDQA